MGTAEAGLLAVGALLFLVADTGPASVLSFCPIHFALLGINTNLESELDQTRDWQVIERSGSRDESSKSPGPSNPLRPGWCSYLDICQGDLGLQLLHLLL